MGSRYGGLKQIDPVGVRGETILEYSVYDAVKAGFGKVVFIIRKSIEQVFREKIGATFDKVIPLEYVFQEFDTPITGLHEIPAREKPWGTGHAVLVAAPVIREPFAVINADDFYGSEAFQAMAHFLVHYCKPTQHAMIGYELCRTLSDFGAVSRGVCTSNKDLELVRIVETHCIQRSAHGLLGERGGETIRLEEKTPVSMNFWGFHPAIFEPLRTGFMQFVDENRQHPKAEYYIPLVADALVQKGTASFRIIPSQAQWFGVTYQEDRPFVVESLKELSRKGVYPATGLWSK